MKALSAVPVLFCLLACAEAPESAVVEDSARAMPAENRDELISEELVREDTTVVDAWALDLVERSRCRPHSDVCTSDLLAELADGSRRTLASGLQGPFLVLRDARRVFSCESNSIMSTRGPQLIDLEGAVHDLPEHMGHLRVCQPVGDGEQVLLVYNIGHAGGVLYNVVRVFDSSGAILFDERLDSAATVEVTGKNGRFSVNVPAPEVPG